MLLLGLLLLAATGAFTGLLIADNLSGGPDYQVTVLGHTIATMNSLEIFLSGLALALIFCLGLAMTGTGGVLARRRRSRLRAARHAVGRADTARPEAARPEAARPATVRPEPGHPAAGQGVATSGAAEPTTTGATEPTERMEPVEPAEPVGAGVGAPSQAEAHPRRHRHLFGY